MRALCCLMRCGAALVEWSRRTVSHLTTWRLSVRPIPKTSSSFVQMTLCLSLLPFVPTTVPRPWSKHALSAKRPRFVLHRPHQWQLTYSRSLSYCARAWLQSLALSFLSRCKTWSSWACASCWARRVVAGPMYNMMHSSQLCHTWVCISTLWLMPVCYPWHRRIRRTNGHACSSPKCCA